MKERKVIAMRMLHRRSVLPPIAILASAGCGAAEVVANCTDQGNAGIVLTLEDSTTGARHPFTGIVAVAAEGTFRDTAQVTSITEDPHSSIFVALVFERAGTYGVTVQADGYALWTISGVQVSKESVCNHVITRSLVAKLSPLAAP
jgi:hypothetical protein